MASAEIELEKAILEQMNCLLEYHWQKSTDLHDFYFYLMIKNNTPYRIKIDGPCVGRRYWQSLLEVVNAYCDMVESLESNSPLISIYEPFRGLKSETLEELAIKINLVLQKT